MNGSMLQRCKNWDYRQRAIYMITVTVEGRRPLLGILEGDEHSATIRKSAIGKMVEQCWMDIPKYYPGVKILAAMVMPDHFHGVPFVTVAQEKPLGAIIRGFKAGTSKAWREMGEAGQVCPATEPAGPQDGGSRASMPGHRTCPATELGSRPVVPHTCGASLWSPGYHDRILFRRGQLATMLNYVADNPRRLAVRRAHPELFRVVRNMLLCGQSFSAIGNPFLLQQPVRLTVQCSRNLTEDGIVLQKETLLIAARHGAVLISPCISPGEKMIARAALDAGLPLVVLLENGFAEFYKPPAQYFTACEKFYSL